MLASGASGASVGPSGYTNDFSAQPPTADWATISRAGASTDTYDMDTDVNANITASGTTTQTQSSVNDPPGATGNATWSSPGKYLQTRPSGVRFTALMGKFINNTGTNAAQVTVSYLFRITLGGIAEDPGKGTRVYYSLTGLTNQWTNLASLNVNSSTDLLLTLATNLTLNWTNGGTFYLLWVDDNGSGTPDPANQIDNFSLRVTSGSLPVFACAVSMPTNNALMVSSKPITAAASLAYGTGPFTVEFFTNSGVGNTVFASAGAIGTPPYNLSLGMLPPGTYNIYAVATDSAGSPAIANSLTNTFVVAAPINFLLTGPIDGASIDHNTSVFGTASVSGGTAPYSVQFYLDGAAIGGPLTSAPYSRNFGPIFVGDHTVTAIVTDANGRSEERRVGKEC